MDILGFRMMTIDTAAAEELCDSHQEKGEKKIIVSKFANDIPFSIEYLRGKKRYFLNVKYFQHWFISGELESVDGAGL